MLRLLSEFMGREKRLKYEEHEPDAEKVCGKGRCAWVVHQSRPQILSSLSQSVGHRAATVKRVIWNPILHLLTSSKAMGIG